MGRSQHRGRNRRREKDQLQNQGADAGSLVLDILVSSRSCMYDNVICMGVIYLTADFRLHGMSRTCCTVCVEKSTEWEAMQSRGELFTVFLDKVFREIFALV